MNYVECTSTRASRDAIMVTVRIPESRSLFSSTKEQTVVISCNNIFPIDLKCLSLIAGIFLQVELAKLTTDGSSVILK